MSKRRAQQLAFARKKRHGGVTLDEARTQLADAIGDDSPVFSETPWESVHWNNDFGSDSNYDTDDDDDDLHGVQYLEPEETDPLKKMMASGGPSIVPSIKYQRSVDCTDRQKRRLRAEERVLQSSVKNHSQPLINFFRPSNSLQPVAHEAPPSKEENLINAATEMEMKMKQLKKEGLGGPNLVRHEAVLRLLYSTLRRTEDQTREDI